MTQPNPTALVARAASSYQKPAANKPSATTATDHRASALLDRSSRAAFVVELSAAAKHHISGSDVGRIQSQRPNGGQAARNIDDDIAIDSVQETSLDIPIGEGGRGRREAPLSKSDGSVVFKPVGSIIDIRV